MMNLALDTYPQLERVPWLSGIERAELPAFDFDVLRFADRSSAEASFRSDEWADAKTEAQGDLTGHLSKYHPESYAGYWNNLAKQSRELVHKSVSANLQAAIRDVGVPADMLQPMLVDINRAALEISYRRKFPKVPVFFEKLLKVYQAGHLPCGWRGNMNQWPVGTLMVL